MGSGPRLDPLVATIVLFGAASVVLGGVSPIAVRLVTRSLSGSVERRDGSSPSPRREASRGRSSRRSARPELGTDQVLAVGALTLLVAATIVAVGVRLPVAAVALAAGVAGAAAVVVALEPEQGRTLQGAAARNWSPLYRERETRSPSVLDPSAVAGEGFRVRFAKDTRYHRLVVADDDDCRYLRFDGSFQSGMYLGQPFRTRFNYTNYLDLGLAYNPDARRVLFIGLGGGSAPKRFWRDFPQLQLQVVELDPDVVDVAYRWFALPRSDRLQVDTEDGRRWLRAPPRPVGHDRDRRLLRRLDPVPPGDGGVPRARTLTPRPRRHDRHQHDRRDPGRHLAVAALDDPTYRTVFSTVGSPVFFEGDRDPQSLRNVILVATDGASPSTEFLAQRWDAIRARSPRART